MYTLADSDKFAQKVSKKLSGWYNSDDFHKKAVDRIVLQREEFLSILNGVKKYDVKKLLDYLDKSGFFYRPSSPNKHHNFPGGLAEHSLGVYRIVEAWNTMSRDQRTNSELYQRFLQDKQFDCNIFEGTMDADDMAIAALCHDLCKAERYYFRGRAICLHREASNAHSSLSVRRLKENGFSSPECEELLLAVETHMRLFTKPNNQREKESRTKGRSSMLAILIWAADKLDASRHPVGKRHNHF